MKNWLLKPFPFVQSLKQVLIISICVSFFVTLFLYIFRPFGIGVMGSPLLFLSGYGASAFISVFFSMQFLPKLFPSWFNVNQWNVKKNIFFMMQILLLVSLLNWLYGLLVFNLLGSDYFIEHKEPISFFMYVGMTFAVGIFPVFITNYIVEIKLLSDNLKLATSMQKSMDGAPLNLGGGDPVVIPLDGNKTITISSKDLLCAKAEGGNYVTIFWKSNDELKSQLWRITLVNLLNKIKSDKNIVQCHKSYLVNRFYISEVTGNARTLVLQLQQLDFEIPVSRNFPREMVNYNLRQQA